MNNRYLYRAKTDNGEWVEGYYFKKKIFKDSTAEEHFIMTSKEPKRGRICKAIFFVIDPTTICQCTGLHDTTKWGELTNEEQQKFLSSWNFEENRKNQKSDWKGKLIWENDILMCHGNRNDLVKAVFGEFYVIDAETLEKIDRVIGWHYEVIPTDSLSRCEPFCISMPLTEEYVKTCEFEVIGNIFDNPELLEVGE